MRRKIFLASVYMILSVRLDLRVGELFISGKTSLTCGSAKYGEAVSFKNLLVETLYMCSFLRFNVSPKKIFVSCEYCLFFACLADSFGYPKQMMKTLSNWLSNFRIKYISNTINQQIYQQSTRDLLCTAVLTTFFDYYAPAREHSLFFTFIGSQICKYGFLKKKLCGF